ncbi:MULTISPECIES: NAD(P)-dependent oxidoreductase [Mameliella]|uniref:NAD(P)-dependent oxidoreductase n=1 Tax=Mameliella TaxID=1434019 RepID=UPI000B532F9F|nr:MULTISPECIES: NAD(P)-dependent oxidoreductase [Mameliella]OWV55452.1 2-hydroxy-3-oxopropionate reductase [Mameliella alba]
MTEFKRIAFIGLGQMGLHMAKNLVAGGFPVIGFDAYEQARVAAAGEGIEVVSSLNEAVEGADCIITMLPNGKIVQDAVLGGDAFLKANAGAVLLEMSSSAPTDTRVLSDKVSPHLRVVDAPVSGGVKRAVSGSLTIMAGGETEALNQAMPVLDCLASSVFACGPVGAGHAMKSINNFVSGAGVIAAVEAVTLGTAFGLSADTIIDVLNASSGKNNATDVKMKQFVLSGTFASGFALGLMAKDIGIAAELANDLGLNLSGLKQTSTVWNEAAEAIGNGADHTRIYEFLAKSSV